MVEDCYGDQVVIFCYGYVVYVDGVVVGKDVYVIDWEVDCLVECSCQQYVVVIGVGFDGEDFIVFFFEFYGDFVVVVDLDEIVEFVVVNCVVGCGEYYVEVFLCCFVFGQWYDCGDVFVGFQWKYVDYCFVV